MAWEQLLYGAPKPPDAVGSFLTGQHDATVNAENSYNLYQKRKLQELMSDRSIYNPDGSINYALLQDKGAAAGIGKTALDESTSQIQKKWEAANRVAENKVNLDLLGVNLDEARPQVPGGLPMPVEGREAPTGYDWTAAWDNPAQSAIGENAPKVEVPEGQAINLGSTVLPGSDISWVDRYFPLEPKTDQWFDKVDTMQPKIAGLPDTSGPGNFADDNADNIDYETLAADPERKARMDQYLATLGIKEPGQAGIDAMIAKIRASIPNPVTNSAALSVGKKERSDEIGRVTQGRVDAKAKRQAAVNAFRDGIMGNIGTLQTQDLSRQSNDRAKTEQEYGLAGQRDEKLFARPVSDDEATRVKMYNAVKDDIKNAPMTTFAGQYQAALAKAKADGSVNADAIMANLVSMGSIPSSDALALKSFMTPGGNLTSEGLKWAAKYLDDKIRTADPSLALDWGKRALSNIDQSIIYNGGRVQKEYSEGARKKLKSGKVVRFTNGQWVEE